MLTNQEIYDHVVRHLLTQNEKSLSGNTCMYRDEEGNKCAVGCLIPDDVYKLYGVLIEGLVMFDIINEDENGRPLIKVLKMSKVNLLTSTDLLCALQDVHDSHQPVYWKRQLESVGRAYALNIEVLKEF